MATNVNLKTHICRYHIGLQMYKEAFTGHQLQPVCAGLCTGGLVGDLGVEPALDGRHQVVGEGGDDGDQTLREQLVCHLKQLHTWGGEEGWREGGKYVSADHDTFLC